MFEPDGICPIWLTIASVLTRGNGEDVDSPRAGGKYHISENAKSIIKSDQFCDNHRIKLTTWLINQRNAGISCPDIRTSTIRNIMLGRKLQLKERLFRALDYMRKICSIIGSDIYIAEEEDSVNYLELLAWSESISKEEVVFIFKTLAEQGWIKIIHSSESDIVVNIQSKGYLYLEDQTTIIKGREQAFVAMWFDKSLNPIYEQGFCPAIEDAGYSPVRIDRKDYINKIDDEIIAEIRRSKFVVADFTQDSSGARGGVYYEAGFAHGLNIPVIFTCRRDCIREVHFDTRQYNHISWQSPEELRRKLYQRITATIGDGPLLPK